MAKRQVMPAPAGEFVRDEAIHIPTGDTVYTVDLDQQTVDELALGVCPESLAERMFRLMSWRRAALRQEGRRGRPEEKLEVLARNRPTSPSQRTRRS